MYLLPFPHVMHRYLFASASHSVRHFIHSHFLSTKLRFSFGCGLSSSQSFHSSTKHWKLTAYCKVTYTSCLVFFIVAALTSVINPSSSITPAFVISSAFSFPSVTNLFNFCHFFFFFLRAVCLHICHSCDSSQFFIHKSASPGLDLAHSFSPFHNPSIIPLLSTSHDGTSHVSETLGSAVILEFCLH